MLVEVEQGSDEWFSLRKSLLTASVAGSAAGLKPRTYLTRGRLYDTYFGWEQPSTDAMFFGEEFEDHARDSGERAVGALSYRVGLHVSDDYPWLGASTDGMFHKMGLHEIKCRATEPYESISPQHMAQIQVQLECAGCGRCYFQSWTPDQQRIWIVKRSREYFAWLLPHLEEFWGYVQRAERPPDLHRRRAYEKEAPGTQLIYEGDS